MAVQGTERTGVKVAKAVVATTATAAAATGAALLLARTGKLDQFVGKNKVADKAINGAKGLADDIAKFAEPHLAKAKKAFSGIGEKIRNCKPFRAASKFAKGVVDTVKTRLGKFNPDLAPAKEKMAETFNNFVG